jgi:hypothetical protein
MKTNNTLLLIATTTVCHLSGVNAAVTVTVNQVGSNVVFSGSGSFNLSALTPANTGGYISDYMNPSMPTLVFGDAEAGAAIGELYFSLTVGGPSSYGMGGASPSDSSGGTNFGLDFLPEVAVTIWVPLDYASNSPLNATMTFENETFATLGLTEGTYTWTWSTDGNNDSMTVNIIPEPATSLLGALTFAAAFLRRRRHLRTCLSS